MAEIVEKDGVKYVYITEYSDAQYYYDLILDSPTKPLGSDTEGTGLDPHTSKMRLFQLALDDVAYMFDVFAIGQDAFVELTKKFLKRAFKRKAFIFQNFMYDLKMFWSMGIDFTGQIVFDTMIAAKVLECGLGLNAGLKDLMQRYLGIEMDKTEQKSNWGVTTLTESQKFYAAKDVLLMRRLANELQAELKAADLLDAFKLDMRALYGFAMMEYYGVKVDLERLSKVAPFYENNLKEASKQFLDLVPVRYVKRNLLGEILDEGINPGSAKQKLAVLREMGIPNPLYNPNSRNEKELDPIITSTGKDVTKLLDVIEYPILEPILLYSQTAFILSTYIYGIPELVNPVTKRLHTAFDLVKNTGRSSSSKPNLQNLPRNTGKEPVDELGIPLTIRSSFVREEGFKFCLADYSQIELRVIAAVCRDKNMLDEFLSQKDPYSNTAAFLAGLSYEELVNINPNGEDKVKPQYKKIRQSAKAVRLGLNYGMWWKKLRNYARQQYGVTMTQEEAKNNYNRYFLAYPGLKQYHEIYSDKSIREVRTLEPFRRRRLWEDYPGVPQLCNLPIQGTAGDIQKLAIANIYEELYRDGYNPCLSQDVRLVLNVHDELEIEAKEDKAEYAREMLERNMVAAGEYVIHDCPILADAAIVDNLAQKE